MKRALALIAGLALLPALAQNRPPLPKPRETPIERKIGKAPPMPMYSQRGEIAVFARDESRAMLRWPVMQFAERTKADLERLTKLGLGSIKVPLEIGIGSETNSTHVLVQIAKASDGDLRARIEVPDPDHCDLFRLREVITGTLLTIWIEENRSSPFAVTPPHWLIYGLARNLELAERLQDTEAFWLAWSECRTPLIDEILGASGVWLNGHPPTRTMLALFLAERWPGGLRELIGDCAEGREITPGRIYSQAFKVADSGWGADLAADRIWDAWCDKQVDKVIVLGALTSGALQRWAASLSMNFTRIGADLSPPWIPRPPAWALARAEHPAVRIAAKNLIPGLYTGTVMRHLLLENLANQYAGYFDALARGTKKEALTLMLQQAENTRRSLALLLRKGPLYTHPEETPAP